MGRVVPKTWRTWLYCTAEDEDDDVFNTAYIDAITTGAVKLAYIPDSPIDQPEDDPFDTSIAERAILGIV